MKRIIKKVIVNNDMNIDEIKDMLLSAFMAGAGIILAWMAMWIFY